MDDLDNAYRWVVKTRKKYSSNSDIWNLCRVWENIKNTMLGQLNNGSYEFSPLERYEMEDRIVSLWSSPDMIALKLITQALGHRMEHHIQKSCYHVKNHGGLKKAVRQTHAVLLEYQFVFRSDIKSYYDSINFEILLKTIKHYIEHPVLLKLINKACKRTETRGGIFYDYHEQGLPMGSPLSPLLGAIALIPLDQAMGQMKNIFYARFMDDWVVFTKSKTALRKVIKRTHHVMHAIKFKLHPMKTYIGKISHGFNFLGYYMDNQKILPSQETIRRFHERASALYEPPPKNLPRCHLNHERDISLYPANEAAPCDDMLKDILTALWKNTYDEQIVVKRMRRYVDQWARWLNIGLSSVGQFTSDVTNYLPSLCWCDAAVCQQQVR